MWVPDHLIMSKGDAIFNSLVVLSALAPLTTSIHLGTVVLCNIFRYPGLLAKMIAINKN
ncbi:MAG: LLM class flavin-dependent oxidoreductase [Promethearchaeota archaeon]